MFALKKSMFSNSNNHDEYHDIKLLSWYCGTPIHLFNILN